MLPRPRFDRLTLAYFQRQSRRFAKTLQAIQGRPDPASGRVVPVLDDLAIHDGRHIDATVMFLDICGFSQRPSWTAAEQQVLLNVLSLFFTEMIRIVEDHGGTVEKNTGDGLMAYFTRGADGVPAPQKGIAAALTMFDARLTLINPTLISSGVAPIDFRICLDHGPVTIARVGAARGFNGVVAIGATANIASKMLAQAGGNQILIGSEMLAGLPDEWLEKFVRLQTTETGWTERTSGRPYAFWEYQGRWQETLR